MKEEFHLYAGRWIAVIDGKVVGQGGTPDQALQAASTTRFKETPEVFYVPYQQPLIFSPILYKVREVLPGEESKYLVGGAIRDALLNKPVHDYDIVLNKDSLRLARKVADQLGGSYFPLDEDRETARIILQENGTTPTIIDFATIRGGNLESDLRERDFTLNAIALCLSEPNELLDPLGGTTDLKNRKIRACSNSSFRNDPVRILRAIRLAAGLELKILPETRELITQAIPLLVNVSPERLRDELFRILDGPKPATAILALEIIGVIPYTLPELTSIRNVPQSPPHNKDVWSHTIDTLKYLELLINVVRQDPDEISPLGNTDISTWDSSVRDIFEIDEMKHQLTIIGKKMCKFQDEISNHLGIELVFTRSVRSLVFFAALYHDAAKPDVQTVDEQGRISFDNHEKSGCTLVAQRASALKLSNAEVDRIKAIVKGHMQPTFLSRLDREPTSREIYRFFRVSGESGIDICLLSLADLLATYGTSIPQERLERQLCVVEQLMDAWWNFPEQKINPVPLISGWDILTEFDLKPGPIIGYFLERIREEQVEETIKTREEALAFIKNHIEAQIEKHPDKLLT